LELSGIVGSDHVLTQEAEREFFSTDLSFRDRKVAALVAQPGSTAELAAIIAKPAAAGFNIGARGGGMSYTSGYTPETENTVLVDMRRMDRIIEINEDDMYVVVECGCTWKKLYEALQEKGLRTPYFGPLS